MRYIPEYTAREVAALLEWVDEGVTDHQVVFGPDRDLLLGEPVVDIRGANRGTSRPSKTNLTRSARSSQLSLGVTG